MLLGVVCRRIWLAAAVAAVAAPAEAQVFTPSYQSPVLLSDIGVYASDGPGDVTLEGIYRTGALGLRLGFVDTDGDDLISVGGDFRSPLALSGAPLRVALTAGAQALIGEADAVGLQLGLSAGARLLGSGLAVTPYIHPRIAFINGFGPDDGFDADLIADIGADVELAEGLVARLGVGLTNETADFGLGLAWRR